MNDEKIIIIGGGIIGCSTAWMLKSLNPNLKVLILEKNNQIAHEHSFQSEGIFSAAMNTPWNGYKLLRQAIDDFDNPDSLISINPILFITIDFWIWALRFAYNSFFQFDKKIENIYKLARRTNDLHKRLYNDSRWKYNHLHENYLGKDAGTIEIFLSDIDFNGAKRRLEVLNKKYGERLCLYSNLSRCKDIEHHLNIDSIINVKGCMKNNSEHYSAYNTQKLAEYLMRIAIEEGARIEYKAEVEGFRFENNKVVAVKIKGGEEITGDKIIICCGAHSRKIGRLLGWTPPIWPVKGYSLNIEAPSRLKYSAAFTFDKPINIGSMGSYYRVSSFIEFSTIRDKDVNPEKCLYMLKNAQIILNLKKCDALGYWAFQRAVTVDDLPIIGKFPKLENVYINAGHGARSSSLCLASSELISHIILGQTPLINPHHYSPNRFWI
ncbi:hypothetical protein SteCoe_15655 [Stentor coeruleus]|uniref:FAD dependent oxidoreductase domain-containing protein n=1 Tax=Stentor coeruleus TaxID=5963 RepID=A0A1R2C342_9CILI|nr:hypothetical protein SteCoe_15655 [Stentor coeruleus]